MDETCTSRGTRKHSWQICESLRNWSNALQARIQTLLKGIGSLCATCLPIALLHWAQPPLKPNTSSAREFPSFCVKPEVLLPFCPLPSQKSPISILASYLFKIQKVSNVISFAQFPPPKASFEFLFPANPVTCPTHFFLLCLITIVHLVRSKSHEYPHYVIISIIVLSSTICWPHIYSSAPPSPMPSACDNPLIWQTKCHTHWQNTENYIFYNSSLGWDSKRKYKMIWTKQ